jgi:hypothetical protein
LRQLKFRLRMLMGRSKCPYCGFGEITVFDHYLPKARFPEFSVCADNLIPCCSRCNELRGDRDWSPGRRPAAIHVFHEPIDIENTFLRATIDIQTNPVTVAFSVTTDVSKPFSERFSRHFLALDLATRFAEEAIGEIQELVEDIGSAIELHTGDDVARDVAQQCAHKALSRQKLHGANHWKVAFYRAAAASGDFIEFLLRRGGWS